MRSKAPLAMMEQMVMLLVFALAAALCLQAFVKSDQLSKGMEARDQAVTLCQNAAEIIHATKGDLAQAAEQTDVPGYTLGTRRIDSGVSGLGKAEVWVQEDESGAELFRIEVAWQEVSAHG